MIKIKASDNILHSVGDIAVKINEVLYHGLKAVVKKDGALYVIWEKVKEVLGFIKTNDGNYIKTNDGNFIKCNNQ